MKRWIILILLATIVMSGCSKETDTWRSVVNKEWENFDVWAGSGIYFHEEDDKKYCTFMIYGSGVIISNYYVSEVTVIDETLIIHLPSEDATNYLGVENTSNAESVDVEIALDKDILKVSDYEYKIIDGDDVYQYIDKAP